VIPRCFGLFRICAACFVAGEAALAGVTEAPHWAFQPVQRDGFSIPADDASNPADSLIALEQERAKLNPVPPADARTLARRITFDLTGLPPTPAAAAAFVAAHSADPSSAVKNLVDQLLDSRHYGERWGRHWLDLVRYADTAGDAADFPVPEAYKYRNYVIDAFNKDKPYDQFVREQIAGDLLPFENDNQRWEQIVATGYVAISRRIGVSPHGLRHITIEDTLDNLGKTFLGLTVGCARCHDHKHDPIPTEDYYALYGFFDSSVYPHAGAEHRPWRKDFVYRIGKEESEERLRDLRAELEEWNKKEREQMEIYRSFQREKVSDPNLTRESTWADLLIVRAQRAEVAKRFPDLEIAYALQEGEGHDVHVHKAGSPATRDQGALVRRGFLQVLGGEKLTDSVKGSGREYLANWIVDSSNPLTARVMVNRIWLHHFGSGLVTTPSDFGTKGMPPSHAELLDFLADWFMDHDWSVKGMHRLIMNSATYQRSAARDAANAVIDPENRMFWRANRRRLDAEQLRDTILMFSGQLDFSIGGEHPFPHRLTYFYRQHDPFQEVYKSNRRSVYLMQQRIQKNPFLELFDGPDGNLPLADRNESTTGPQALYFINAPFVHEQSVAIAESLLAEEPGDSSAIRNAYELIFNRPPTDPEIEKGRRFLVQLEHELNQTRQDAWAGFLRGMISSNEFMFIE
jgi:hypothetical protein